MKALLACFTLLLVGSALTLQGTVDYDSDFNEARVFIEQANVLAQAANAQEAAGNVSDAPDLSPLQVTMPSVAETATMPATEPSAEPAAEPADARKSTGDVLETAVAADVANAFTREEIATNTSSSSTEDGYQNRSNLPTYFNPELMAVFREKQTRLNETMKSFMVSKKELDVAKLAANLAMKRLRLATQKRRKILISERMAEAEERRAIKERRQAKKAMTERAEQLLVDSFDGLSGVNLSFMVDVVVALPEALQDEGFVEDFRRITEQVHESVRRFLDHVQQKTSQFVKDSTSASDAELRFIMAKYFHESGFGLKGLHQDTLKAIQTLRGTVPEDLERALFPFLGQLNANTARLRVNATGLALATPREACDQITQIVANVSDYDSKLETVGKVIENVSARVLPTLFVSPNITTFVGSFLDILRLEVGGLQEAAQSMVARTSPIIAERVQCTFSGLRARCSLGLVTMAAAFTASWALL